MKKAENLVVKIIIDDCLNEFIMVKLFAYCTILIALISCNRIEVVKREFTEIDFSMTNGFSSGFFVHIDSSNSILIKKIDLRSQNQNSFYEGQLNDSLFNLLNMQAKIVLAKNVDTLYSNAVCGGSKSLILKSNGKKINTVLYGESHVPSLDSLIETIMRLQIMKFKVSKDTSFVFESYKPIAPPKIELVKFVPPIIK